jgi:hypothetical protein
MNPRPYLLLALLLATPPLAADTVALRDGHPDRYIVVKGDTLWDIAARFLRDPWRWANVWNKNDQIRNPHLIYPGDVIILTYRDGQPELGVLRNQKLTPAAYTSGGETGEIIETPPPGPVVKLSPDVRSEPLPGAIPTIKPEAIAPFLSEPLAIERRELNKAGYVTTGLDDRVALGSLSQFYARGLGDAPADYYKIFRPGKALRHPDTGEVLAYEAMFLGEAKVLETGDPTKLEVVRVKQEIVPGDRLLAAGENPPLPYYYPHAPERPVAGRILSALNGVEAFGPNTVVAISLGARDGMEAGQVLRIMRHVGKHRDPITKRKYRLPDEQSGLLMVFRPYEKVSYALVMYAERPVHIHDAVTNP